MTIQSTHTRKFQWKWVGITIAAYVVLYVLPILVTGGAFSRTVPGHTADILLGIWSFAGIIIIAAVVGYLSEGVTLWEPAVGAALLLTAALAVVAVQIFRSPVGHKWTLWHVVAPMLVMVAIVFLLSLLGAWFGEFAQRLWRKKPPESA
jgi:hypothetical protein